MTTFPISRRDFFRYAGGAVAAAAWWLPAAGAESASLGLVLPRAHPAAAAVRAGAELGAGEARRLAELVGASFDLAVGEAADAREAVSVARQLVRGGAEMVFGGVDGRSCDALAAALPERYVEVRARQEVAPRAQAIRHLSVTPPYGEWAAALARGLARAGLRRFSLGDDDAAMRAAARRAGLVEVAPERAEVVFGGSPRPGGWLAAGVALPLAPGTAAPVAWHPSLRRYGASELNERFLAHSGRPMDGDAWGGWMAVKLVVEAALRRTPAEKARADGHKGVSLTFADGFLRQPLYVALHRAGEVEVIDS